MNGFQIFIVILLAAVTVVLIAGIVLMGRGGELNRKYGNKLMVARVALQALVVVALGLMFLFGRL